MFLCLWEIYCGEKFFEGDGRCFYYTDLSKSIYMLKTSRELSRRE